MKYSHLSFALLALLLLGCRKAEIIVPEQVIPVAPPVDSATSAESDYLGFYLLNEGNMGSNKSTLDYMDLTTGKYHRNIFAERNPHVARELGDVGNDIGIYGSKLYAVINCSHFVEVMDAQTATHIGVVSIPNCRYLCFHGGYAYVTSYAGPVKIDPNARPGYVAKVDTATLQVVDTCVVGYQPDEIVRVGSKLYVANSGGYRGATMENESSEQASQRYDRTVSVIDIGTFKEIKRIDVAINLHRLEVDADSAFIYVSSRGDYYDIPSRTLIIDPHIDECVGEVLAPNGGPLACTNITRHGDSLYLYSVEWSWYEERNTITYAIINTQTQRVVSRMFITDGSHSGIEIPYGLAVHPENGNIYVTDAKNYVTPGKLHCYSPDGKHLWEVTTGDIPAHFVWLKKKNH
ncbi:MAG: YncE family protein [Bacteroidales bacterium]|nr:YncE family protein [Bacteroidales bacterium]